MQGRRSFFALSDSLSRARRPSLKCTCGTRSSTRNRCFQRNPGCNCRLPAHTYVLPICLLLISKPNVLDGDLHALHLTFEATNASLDVGNLVADLTAQHSEVLLSSLYCFAVFAALLLHRMQFTLKVFYTMLVCDFNPIEPFG